MELYDIIFYFFALMIVGSAAVVVGSKNLAYSAFSLLFTFLGVAGIYVMLGADFIGVVQLMVYVGGILILLLFGIMLTNKITSVEIRNESTFVIPTIIAVGIFAAFLIFVMTETNWTTLAPQFPNSTIKLLGRELLTSYSFVFELLAVILLIALIGAATLARNDNKEK